MHALLHFTVGLILLLPPHTHVQAWLGREHIRCIVDLIYERVSEPTMHAS